MAHSPGPWRTELSPDAPLVRIIGANDYPICRVPITLSIGDDDEANARLIAASPTLLEACGAAIGFCVNARETWDDWQDHTDIGLLFGKLRVAIDAAIGEHNGYRNERSG